MLKIREDVSVGGVGGGRGLPQSTSFKGNSKRAFKKVNENRKKCNQGSREKSTSRGMGQLCRM